MTSYANYSDLLSEVPVEGKPYTIPKYYTLPVVLEEDSETGAITYNLPLLEEFMEAEYSFGQSETEGSIIEFDRDMFEEEHEVEPFNFERVKIGEELYWQRKDTGCLFTVDRSNETEEGRGWLKHICIN